MKKHLLLALASCAAGAIHATESQDMTSVVAPYLQIQSALSEDNLSDAKAGAQQLLEKTRSSPESDVAARLANPAQKLANASNVAVARASFRVLSQQLIESLELADTQTEQNLYTFHCSMAFNNEGAYWIQDNKSATNPYFGVSMYRCGSLVTKNDGQSATKESSAPACGMSCCEKP